MSAPARRRLVHASIGVAATAVFIVLTVLLLRRGLDDADKISSVISMVATMASLVLAIWSLRKATVGEKRESPSQKYVIYAKRNDTLNVGDHQQITVNVEKRRRPARRQRD